MLVITLQNVSFFAALSWCVYTCVCVCMNVVFVAFFAYSYVLCLLL